MERGVGIFCDTDFCDETTFFRASLQSTTDLLRCSKQSFFSGDPQ
jgi:hypothetical protein